MRFLFLILICFGLLLCSLRAMIHPVTTIASELNQCDELEYEEKTPIYKLCLEIDHLKDNLTPNERNQKVRNLKYYLEKFETKIKDHYGEDQFDNEGNSIKAMVGQERQIRDITARISAEIDKL
ncbi:hypothetical protein PPACK8108_LOCUS1322 [Phakopsora pachyrhizi]|uniref:Uncharacterized protein n=1 Tax=Phakopsora pachyrhizi TaxID=170000 RepID=A0AAV0AFP5_PHAPC|nr:hypothetical protein PPACK8108_LOCUS1322 [Phakopsora pachyrhizi]